jgi:hypothetical protein
LRSKLLAELVGALERHGSADAALVELVPEAEWPSYRRALGSLADSRFICAR